MPAQFKRTKITDQEMKAVRILIAVHQSKVRFALRVALERRPGFKTIDEASDARDVIAHAQAICPDLAIVDWDLPELPMVDLIRALRQQCHDVHVLVLCSRAEERDLALAAGANQFLCKYDAPAELLTAIDHCFKTEESRAGSRG